MIQLRRDEPEKKQTEQLLHQGGRREKIFLQVPLTEHVSMAAVVFNAKQRNQIK